MRCSLKLRSILTAKKPSHPREEALQPTRRKAGLINNGSEALGGKEIEKDPQEGTENYPQRGEEASETAWDHLSPSYDIIFVSAFDKMGIKREKLEPVSTHLRGFSGEKVLPLGSIQLVLTLGDPRARQQRQ